MPRNGTGTYSLPQPPFQPQTSISSAAVNSDFSDIATALTGSLPRNGEAGMNAVLPLAASGFTYSNDTDTGMYRSNADEQKIRCGGVDVVTITTTGLTDANGNAIAGFVLGVPYPWVFSTPPTGCVFAYGQPCTSTYPLLRAALIADGSRFGSSGPDPLFPDMRGVAVAGKSNMGGSDRGNLTGATTLGASIGAQSVTLDATQIPSHSHTGSGTTSDISANHTHAGSGNTGTQSANHTHTGGGTTSGVSAGHTHTGSGTTGGMNANNPHSHGITLSAANVGIVVYVGSATSFEGVKPGAGVVTLASASVDNANIDHGHSYSFTTSGVSNDHTHTYSFTSSTESASHFHAFSLTTAVNSNGHTHTYSFTTSSVGGGLSHNNVQPTIALNYIMRAA